MSVNNEMAQFIKDRILTNSDEDSLLKKVARRMPENEPLKSRIPAGNDHTVEGLRKRQEFLKTKGLGLECLASEKGKPDPAELQGNIENLVGFAQIPVGIIGPLRINGIEAHDDFYIPMATTEGALLASYNRGAYVISQSGGAAAMCLTEAVPRAPCFVFECLADSCVFLRFVMDEYNGFPAIIAKKSRHCKLLDMKTSLLGKNVFLGFEYFTGDAAGQNMVTIVTDEICRWLVEKSPVKPARWYVEGNLSGDKKATMMSFLTARGKKVVAEAVVKRRILERFVHVTPEEFLQYGHVAFLGGALSGSIGVQGHFANALAALFIACGQDVACVSEASTGLNDMDITKEGDLYMSVTLSNMIVGTVGGGTKLPTARECLSILGCLGDNSARKFAEICAATVLAGEISIIGALAAGEFAAAHAKYGRRAGK